MVMAGIHFICTYLPCFGLESNIVHGWKSRSNLFKLPLEINASRVGLAVVTFPRYWRRSKRRYSYALDNSL